MVDRGQDAERLREALAVVLDALRAPAFLLDGAGRVEMANAAARSRVDGDPQSLSQRIQRLLESEADRASVQRIGDGGDGWTLVVDHDGARGLRAEERLAEVAARLALTRRQREILALVSRGLSNRSIATTLAISEATVEQHVGSLIQRAGVESRTGLIALLLWG